MLKKSLFIKPNIALEGRRNDAAPALTPCPQCRRRLTAGEKEENLQVCPLCGYHFRIGARKRIAMLADADSFRELDGDLTACDRLHFPQYEEKLDAARKASGEKEAVISGVCAIQETPCALFAMEADFMMGSMSPTVGEKITRLFEYAAANALPVIGVTVSGGARVQEGILSLMQMAKTSAAVRRHSDAGLFYGVLLTHPTTGGVTASFAMEGDVILAEPGALIGFAGPRVIEQTLRQKLPQGFQKAEFLLKKGFVDAIVPRQRQKEVVGELLRLHSENGLARGKEA
ncbi:MAG: acetyl-CoA carboxylase, carboxyltransferase subunit beta [Firmicutes bacterium]|nr:acetyl-CoA carboxylase, carboxyltransferase subunit beta [Bacillota bacterium]